MLDVKKTLAKLLNYSVPKTSVTSGTLQLDLIRRGNVVMLQSWGNFPSTADGVTMGTVPAGFRPYNTADFTVFSTNGTRLGTMRVFSNGNIVPTFGAMAAGAVRQTFTYVVGGVARRLLNTLKMLTSERGWATC